MTGFTFRVTPSPDDGYGNYRLTDSGAWFVAAYRRHRVDRPTASGAPR